MHVRQGFVVTANVAVVGGAGCGGRGGASCEGCGEFRDVMGAFGDVLERCPISTYPIAYRSRDECAADEECANRRCDTSNGCSVPPGVGQECDYSTPCAVSAYCDTSASSPYSRVARVGQGAPCSSSTSYGAQCLEQYRCVYDSTASEYVCQVKLGNGESCSHAADCASGICSQSLCLATNQCVML